VTYINGEPPSPQRLADRSNDSAFITHRLNFYHETSLHEISHGGRGLFQSSTPYDVWVTRDQPIVFFDGHALIRTPEEVEPRMVVGGSYPGSPGFPGPYLWYRFEWSI